MLSQMDCEIKMCECGKPRLLRKCKFNKNISKNKKGCFNGEKNVIMPRGHKIPSRTIYHASYSFIQGGKKSCHTSQKCEMNKDKGMLLKSNYEVIEGFEW